VANGSMHLPFPIRLCYTVMTDDEFERTKAAERERLRQPRADAPSVQDRRDGGD